MDTGCYKRRTRYPKTKGMTGIRVGTEGETSVFPLILVSRLNGLIVYAKGDIFLGEALRVDEKIPIG